MFRKVTGLFSRPNPKTLHSFIPRITLTWSPWPRCYRQMSLVVSHAFSTLRDERSWKSSIIHISAHFIRPVFHSFNLQGWLVVQEAVFAFSIKRNATLHLQTPLSPSMSQVQSITMIEENPHGMLSSGQEKVAWITIIPKDINISRDFSTQDPPCQKAFLHSIVETQNPKSNNTKNLKNPQSHPKCLSSTIIQWKMSCLAIFETPWHAQSPRRPHHSHIPHPKNQLLHPEIPLQIPLPSGSAARITYLNCAIFAWDYSERERDFGVFEES
jgi:hypothetical protein